MKTERKERKKESICFVKQFVLGKLRGYSAELPFLPLIGIEIQVVYHPYLNFYSENPWKPDGQR